MDAEVIELLITAKDETKAAFQQVTDSLGRMEGGLSKLGGSASGLQKSFDTLFKGLGGAGSLGRVFKDMAADAAKAEAPLERFGIHLELLRDPLKEVAATSKTMAAPMERLGKALAAADPALQSAAAAMKGLGTPAASAATRLANLGAAIELLRDAPKNAAAGVGSLNTRLEGLKNNAQFALAPLQAVVGSLGKIAGPASAVATSFAPLRQHLLDARAGADQLAAGVRALGVGMTQADAKGLTFNNTLFNMSAHLAQTRGQLSSAVQPIKQLGAAFGDLGDGARGIDGAMSGMLDHFAALASSLEKVGSAADRASAAAGGLRREAGESDGPIRRMGESLGTLRDAADRAARPLERVFEWGGHIKDLALGNFLGGMGVMAITGLVGDVENLGQGFLQTNADIEKTRQSLMSIYGSADEANQAMGFLMKNELTVPFDAESIIKAEQTLAGFKDNVTSVLPALEEVSAAYGQNLGTSAQSLVDAQAGYSRMMKFHLRITDKDLVPFGLKLAGNGHIENPEAFTDAFVKYVTARFGDPNDPSKGALYRQSQTFSGLSSSLSSQKTYAELNVGGAAFTAVRASLADMVHFLQQNQQAVTAFEQGVGTAFGRIIVLGLQLGRTLGPYLASAVVLWARLWPAVAAAASTAMGAVSKILAGFGSWFASDAVPFLARNVQAIALVWQDIQGPIIGTLGALWNDFRSFFKAVQGDVLPFWQFVAGAFQIGAGLLQATLGGAMRLLGGDWRGFTDELGAGLTTMLSGMVDAFAGLVTLILPLVQRLVTGPVDWVLHNTHTLADALLAPFLDLAGGVNVIATSIQDVMIAAWNKVIMLVKNVGTSGPIKFLLEHTGMGGVEKNLQNLHELKGQDIGASFGDGIRAAAAAVNAFIPQLSANLHLTTLSAGEAIKAVQAQRTAILAQLGLNTRAARAIDWTGHGGGAGGDVIKEKLATLFKGLGGSLSFSQFLQALGVPTKGATLFPLPGPGGLPVNDPTAGAAAAAAGGAKAAPSFAFGSRPSLGTLQATFGGTVVAQANQTPLDRVGASLQQQQTIQQRQAASLGTISDRLYELIAVTRDQRNEIRDQTEHIKGKGKGKGAGGHADRMPAVAGGRS